MTSKRQRLLDLVKTTKDVYIPSISNTITQLASEATTRALNYTEPQETVINTDTKGAQILLYPHFTRQDNQYHTQCHGWVYSSEGSLRKKKLIFTLARQLAKSNNGPVSEMTATQLDEQLSSIDDESSVSSMSSDLSVRPLKRTGTSSSESSFSSQQSESDEVLKERIANFLNRSLGNTELLIVVGGVDREEMVTVDCLTDGNGNFNIDVDTNFRPTYIQVAIANDEKIFVFRDTIFPGASKYGVISDIDDTIKHTGVCGDKRTIFRNTFTDSMETWEIPGAADCYRFLYQKYDMPFFYVSNSPYQLFSNLVKFFDLFEFPKGSMYLKKYSGNIMNSLFEASRTRKKAPIERILKHFEEKKFFLIGDSSEQDLEAYTDIARSHPDRIAAIYIRVAENSMSVETFKILTDILVKRSVPIDETCQDIKDKFEQLNSSEQNLIDLNDEKTPRISTEHMAELVINSVTKSEGNEDLEQGSSDEFFNTSRGLENIKKSPPQVPSKPRSLQSAPKSAPETSDQLPPLPRRPIPPPPPSRPQGNRTRSIEQPEVPPSFNSNNLMDEQTEEWISRILTSLLVLRKAGNIKLKLFVEFNEIQEDIVDYMKLNDNQ